MASHSESWPSFQIFQGPVNPSASIQPSCTAALANDIQSFSRLSSLQGQVVEHPSVQEVWKAIERPRPNRLMSPSCLAWLPVWKNTQTRLDHWNKNLTPGRESACWVKFTKWDVFPKSDAMPRKVNLDSNKSKSTHSLLQRANEACGMFCRRKIHTTSAQIFWEKCLANEKLLAKPSGVSSRWKSLCLQCHVGSFLWSNGLCSAAWPKKMAGNIILNCSSILLNSKQSPSVISSPWPTAKDAKHARPHPDLCCISSKTSLNVHFTSQILSSRSPVRMKWQLAISSTYCSTLITKIPGNNVQSQTSHFCVDGELLPSVTQILASANQTRTKSGAVLEDSK